MSGPAPTRGRCGTTLLEVLVTVVVIAIVAGVATLALPRVDPSSRDTPEARVARARRDALATGRAVRVTIVRADTLMEATAAPDGSVVADSALHVDRLTGRSVHDAR